MNLLPRLSVMIFGVLFLSGCDSEQEDEGLKVAQLAEVNRSCSGSGENCGVDGYLYYNGMLDRSSSYIRLDLNTGVETSVYESGFGPSPRIDGEEFVAIYNAPSNEYDIDIDIIKIFDVNGSVLQHLPVPRNVAKAQQSISPLGSYIAVGYGDILSDTPGLIIMDRAANLVRYLPDDSEGYITSWAWQNDYSLVVTKGLGIYRLDDLQNGQLELVKLFDNAQPFDIDISPDGQSFAFTLESGNKQDVYTLDAEGSMLQRMTMSDGSSSAYKSSSAPSWSPDGEYLSVVHGKTLVGCVGSSCAGGCADIFIIPVSAPPFDLQQENPSPAFIVNHHTDYVKLSVVHFYFLCISKHNLGVRPEALVWSRLSGICWKTASFLEAALPAVVLN